MGYQYKFDIAGTEYGMSDVASAKIEHPLFDKFSVGNTCSAELDITIWPKGNIPKMARIVPYIALQATSITLLIGDKGVLKGTYSVTVPTYGKYAITFLSDTGSTDRVKINIDSKGGATATYEVWDWFGMVYDEPEDLPIVAAPDNTFPDLFAYTCMCGEETGNCAAGNCPVNPVSITHTGEKSWEQLGVFWIDTREKVGDKLHILAYDAMMRGNVVWKPREDLNFDPETGLPMPDAAAEIASLMDVKLDDRVNEIFPLFSYGIDHPTNDWTLRDVLGFIGAAYGANWIITAEGTLLLVPLFPEAFYPSLMDDEDTVLSTEDGETITLGGVSIAV